MNNNTTNILFFPEKFFKNKLEEIKNSKNEIYKNEIYKNEIYNFNTIPHANDTYSFIKKANNNFPINKYKSNLNYNVFNRFIFNN